MLNLKWLGIVLCLIQSGIFSGLNLGFFGLSRLRLEVQAEAGNPDARRILSLREDAHLLLATLLWGNVSSNVLLAIISDSIFTGLSAFLFSTIVITFFGEIIPQAYFTRNALKTSVVLVPVIRFYQFLLYPITKATALLLDYWLGKEEAGYFRESEIKVLLEKHAHADDTDLERIESIGAVNFLSLDDVLIQDEGEIVNPESIISLPTNDRGLPLFPEFNREFDDPFLQSVHASQEKWVIIVNEAQMPVLVLKADHFLRDAMYEKDLKSVYIYCHRPIVITDPQTPLGDILLRFKVNPEHAEDDVVDNDLILYWNDEKKIITGADLLGRLLRGIVKRGTLPMARRSSDQ